MFQALGNAFNMLDLMGTHTEHVLMKQIECNKNDGIKSDWVLLIILQSELGLCVKMHSNTVCGVRCVWVLISSGCPWEKRCESGTHLTSNFEREDTLLHPLLRPLPDNRNQKGITAEYDHYAFQYFTKCPFKVLH